MDLDIVLERGRFAFLAATRHVSPQHASAKPSRTAWSILECIEHVIAFEARYLEWLDQRNPIPPHPDPQREMRIFSMVRSRLTPLECPERFWPQGRFPDLPSALAEFQSVRDRCVQTVRDLSESVYAIGANHPFFGPINGAEIIQLIDAHARRHAEQISEIITPIPILGRSHI